MLAYLPQGVRSLLFPMACVGCHTPLSEASADPLCPVCFNQLPWGQPLWDRQRRISSGYSLDEVISPLRYEGTAKELILALKYAGRLSLAPYLGRFMATEVVQRLGNDPADLVLPIPLHPVRQRERTFNQAEVLAEALARELVLPCRSNLLLRTQPTHPQAELTREERARNVRGAFALNPDPSIRGQRVLLVDDVLTTGSTAEACAHLLKTAGALHVVAVTAVRG